MPEPEFGAEIHNDFAETRVHPNLDEIQTNVDSECSTSYQSLYEFAVEKKKGMAKVCEALLSSFSADDASITAYIDVLRPIHAKPAKEHGLLDTLRTKLDDNKKDLTRKEAIPYIDSVLQKLTDLQNTNYNQLRLDSVPARARVLQDKFQGHLATLRSLAPSSIGVKETLFSHYTSTFFNTKRFDNNKILFAINLAKDEISDPKLLQQLRTDGLLRLGPGGYAYTMYKPEQGPIKAVLFAEGANTIHGDNANLSAEMRLMLTMIVMIANVAAVSPQLKITTSDPYMYGVAKLFIAYLNQNLAIKLKATYENELTLNPDQNKQVDDFFKQIIEKYDENGCEVEKAHFEGFLNHCQTRPTSAPGQAAAAA